MMKYDTVAVASGNAHKIKEIGELLMIDGVRFAGMREVGVTGDIEENGASFRENALIKAREVCRRTGLPAIADDSGLCVDALDGAPGIYSARFASENGHNASDAENVAKLLGLLENVPEEKRAAHFISAMAVVMPDGREAVVEGICEGRITSAVSGNGGFGYDPVFYYPPFGKTFGEASGEEKNAVSHRRNAVTKLRAELLTLLGV